MLSCLADRRSFLAFDFDSSWSRPQNKQRFGDITGNPPLISRLTIDSSCVLLHRRHLQWEATPPSPRTDRTLLGLSSLVSSVTLLILLHDRQVNILYSRIYSHSMKRVRNTNTTQALFKGAAKWEVGFIPDTCSVLRLRSGIISLISRDMLLFSDTKWSPSPIGSEKRLTFTARVSLLCSQIPPRVSSQAACLLVSSQIYFLFSISSLKLHCTVVVMVQCHHPFVFHWVWSHGSEFDAASTRPCRKKPVIHQTFHRIWKIFTFSYLLNSIHYFKDQAYWSLNSQVSP